jgi:hypothetical protein
LTALSLINGLHYDAAEEERAIRIFAAALAAACQMSLASPSRCLLPPIARLKTERPEFLPALAAAVERDNFG